MEASLLTLPPWRLVLNHRNLMHTFICFSPFGEETNTKIIPFLCINISSDFSFQGTNSMLYCLTFLYEMVRMTESVDISTSTSSPTFILLAWFLGYRRWHSASVTFLTELSLLTDPILRERNDKSEKEIKRWTEYTALTNKKTNDVPRTLTYRDGNQCM